MRQAQLPLFLHLMCVTHRTNYVCSCYFSLHTCCFLPIFFLFFYPRVVNRSRVQMALLRLRSSEWVRKKALLHCGCGSGCYNLRKPKLQLLLVQAQEAKMSSPVQRSRTQERARARARARAQGKNEVWELEKKHRPQLKAFGWTPIN